MSLGHIPYYTLPQTANSLPALGADPNTVTFSGISGGGYMSNVMQIIHSKRVKGTGLVVGGPYGFDWTGYLE